MYKGVNSTVATRAVIYAESYLDRAAAQRWEKQWRYINEAVDIN